MFCILELICTPPISIAYIDGLKEGDTIRVKYKDKMSKEEKIKEMFLVN